VSKTTKILLVVFGGIAVLGVIAVAGVAVVSMLLLKPRLVGAQREKAMQDIRSIEQATQMYYLRKASWPTSLDALAAEKVLDRVPVDPWGNPYLLAVRDGQPVVSSFGADGQPGGSGDGADIP
jgi:general secretion pathway protein G